MKLILVGLTFVSMAFAETVNTIKMCASSTDLSVGSNVNLYECKDEQGSWIKPQFNVSTTAAEAQAISRTVAFKDNNLFTFPLSTSLSFSGVTTCPEPVTKAMTCTALFTYFGTSATAKDGSPIHVDGEGYGGLAFWFCEESAITMYYYFPIHFSTDSAATASGEIKDAVDTFAAIIASSSGPVMEMGNLFKPAAFQKFANVDDSTTTYYLKEDATTFHKIFLSTATTITFTAGDYTAAFGDTSAILTAPTTVGVCANAVQVLYNACGSSNISLALLFMVAASSVVPAFDQ